MLSVRPAGARAQLVRRGVAHQQVTAERGDHLGVESVSGGARRSFV